MAVQLTLMPTIPCGAVGYSPGGTTAHHCGGVRRHGGRHSCKDPVDGEPCGYTWTDATAGRQADRYRWQLEEAGLLDDCGNPRNQSVPLPPYDPTSFVCDVFHSCRPETGVNYHCMRSEPHELGAAHVFGCSCRGGHEAVFPAPGLVAVGRCDLMSHPKTGYNLVSNHLVRTYPLDVERDQLSRLAWMLEKVDLDAFWAAT